MKQPNGNQVEITLNGHPEQVDPGTSVQALLVRLGVKSRPVAVEVNQQIVPYDQHANVRIQPGDVLEVVTLVGGG